MHRSHRTRRASRGKKRKKSRGRRDNVRMLVGGTLASSVEKLKQLLNDCTAREGQLVARILLLEGEVTRLTKQQESARGVYDYNASLSGDQNNDGYTILD
jgi:hypothetical protein